MEDKLFNFFGWWAMFILLLLLVGITILFGGAVFMIIKLLFGW